MGSDTLIAVHRDEAGIVTPIHRMTGFLVELEPGRIIGVHTIRKATHYGTYTEVWLDGDQLLSVPDADKTLWNKLEGLCA